MQPHQDTLNQLYQPVATEFNAVVHCLKTALSKPKSHPLTPMINTMLDSPGKRLRPLLCLLGYRIIQPTTPVPLGLIQVSAALELLHTASLIHDDIIDHAPLRHNKPTLHTLYGQEVAIPMGVYLYTIALGLIEKADNRPSFRKISHAVKWLCEGELRQIISRNNIPTITEYLIIAKKKTAILFTTALFCGAGIANATKSDQLKLQRIGHNLGMLFQITDDYMDLVGSDELKKKAGQDLLMGEVTLPLLYLLEELPSHKKDTILTKLEQKDPSLLPLLQDEFQTSTASQKTKTLGLHYSQEAKDLLNTFPQSPFRDHLYDILSLVESRAF
jgi:heptaprenyl diphosphate synthase